MPVLRSQLCRWTDSANQAIQYLSEFSAVVQQFLAFITGEIAEPLRQNELRFNFHQRTTGAAQEKEEFVRRKAGLPSAMLLGIRIAALRS